MPSEHPAKPDSPRRAWLAAGAVAWLLFVGVNEAVAAASIESWAPHAAGDDHDRYCSCGTACQRDSCCCTPDEDEAASSRPRKPASAGKKAGPPAKAGTEGTSPPCPGMKSAPCGGGSGLPTSSPIPPIGKLATLLGRAELACIAPSGRAADFPSFKLPHKRAARLERPPDPLPPR